MISNWFSNIFNSSHKKKKQLTRHSDTLEEEILNALREVAEQLEQVESEMLDIRNWAADAIKNVFYVPSNFWYIEIDNYTDIKEHQFNSALPPDLVTECDTIVLGYKRQLELRLQKKDFLKNLEQQYTTTLQQLSQTQQAIIVAKRSDSIRGKLNQHLNRLMDMEENLSTLSSSIALNEKYKQYLWEVNQMRDDFQRQKEIYEKLKKLDEYLLTNVLPENTTAYTHEIEKLNKELSNETSENNI